MIEILPQSTERCLLVHFSGKVTGAEYQQFLDALGERLKSSEQVNLVTPTSAVVMGGLAIARVGYGVWWKFVWPVLVLLMILTILVLVGGVLVA